MAAIASETVTQVHHWNDSLFTFRTTRNPTLRFINGQFVIEPTHEQLARVHDVH